MAISGYESQQRPHRGAGRWLYSVLPVAGMLALLPACAVVEETAGLAEASRQAMYDHPSMATLRVDDTFDNVWPVVIEIVEARGHGEPELAQEAEDETYTRTVEVPDQPRDERLREVVTEKRGTIVATTEDGRLVPLRLEEQHEWDMSALGWMAYLADEEENWRLEHDGVEITVPREHAGELHPDETPAVFEDIRKRFGG